jgi:hypothetical protein
MKPATKIVPGTSIEMPVEVNIVRILSDERDERTTLVRNGTKVVCGGLTRDLEWSRLISSAMIFDRSGSWKLRRKLSGGRAAFAEQTFGALRLTHVA